MKHVGKTFLFLALFLLSSLSVQGAEKYGRAMLFQGGGFQTAFFLGMLEATEDLGKAPDAIIGTCGGSVAAAVVNAFPKSADQRQFVESRKFYGFLRSIELTKYRRLWNGLRLAGKMRYASFRKIIPDIFNNYLMKLPFDFGLDEIKKPFGNSAIHIVVVGGEMQFGPEDVGSSTRNKKLYRETYFTDAQTAEALKGFQAPAALLYPQSKVAAQTNTVTDVDTSVAVRVGVSDPYYFPPVPLRNHYYVTGAIDLYPIEVAYRLAREVIMGFSGSFDTLVEQPAIRSTFGYDHNARLRYVNDQKADYWIDLTDETEIFNTIGFNPKLQIKKFGIANRIPATYEEYVERVRKLWRIGYERAKEALQSPPGSKAHIRILNAGNSSEELRDASEELRNKD